MVRGTNPARDFTLKSEHGSSGPSDASKKKEVGQQTIMLLHDMTALIGRVGRTRNIDRTDELSCWLGQGSDN